MQQKKAKPKKRPVKSRKTTGKVPGNVRSTENPKHREDFERLLDDAVLGVPRSKP
jgi:hypothetical protein